MNQNNTINLIIYSFTFFAALFALISIVIFIHKRIYKPTSQNTTSNVNENARVIINFDKNIYTINDIVTMGLVVINKNNNSRCDTNLQLQIIAPNNIQEIKKINTRLNCNDAKVTNDPDYNASYTVKQNGIYDFQIIDTQKRLITNQKIEVIENPIIMIKRSGAMHINSKSNTRYPMIITLTASRDYSGTFVEKLPDVFSIIWKGEAIESNSSLSWNINLKANESKTISYEYINTENNNNIHKLILTDQDNQDVISTWEVASIN